jgi:cyclophilin family peptidyl-prolyl cis-trans isomerase
MRFEQLESRQLLSITLPSISNVTLKAGTTVYVPLSGADSGHTVNYSVVASDYSKLTTVMMPASNKTLRLTVEINGIEKTMDFQLFDNLSPTTTAAIEQWVNAGYYDGLEIYRNYWLDTSTPALIQGGNTDPTSGAIKTAKDNIGEEFNPSLQYTTAGMLGMARTSTVGTSSSEFFITESGSDDMRAFLDYEYTIFGVQTSGWDVVSTIAAMSNKSSSSSYLTTPVSIVSAEIITDNQGGVLQISAPTGVTGSVTVTVTAYDDTGSATPQPFTVTIGADTSSNPTNPFKSVIPTTPTSLAYVPGTSQTTTNSSLQFEVSGVTSGNLVEILCDGNVIGQATANGTTVTVTTDSSTTIADGIHKFTAIQIAEDKTVSMTESSTTVTETADVPSFNSSAVQLTVDTVAPVFNYLSVKAAVVGVPYTCQVAVAEGTSTGVTYVLNAKPDGMSINATTGLITWTPTSGQDGTANVTVRASDAAGNSTTDSYDITVLASNAAPVLTVASPLMGATDENTAFPISLATFINSSTGTSIQDTDTGAVLGGVALTATTGNGTWYYSLDNSTYVAVGSVSTSSALLLPASAYLRYVPDGKNGETTPATITYCAWDTTGGAATGRVDLSGTNATGNSTAYSTASDTAKLTVNGLNDAPELTTATPSLGNVECRVTTTMKLSTFVNNGTGTSAITDVDTNAVIGGIALVGTTGSGTWAYSLDGLTYTSIGTVSATAALLLPKSAYLQYTPATVAGETATIVYRAWDTTTGTQATTFDVSSNGGTTAFSSTTNTASLTVKANAAPVLTAAAPSLGLIASGATTTISLAKFINNGTGTTTVTDTNTDAVIGGMALVGTTGNGTWAYSLDGSTYTNIGTVSKTAALLLPKIATLKYTATSAAETATITYCAWDVTSGTAVGTADTSTKGGTTAFSAATDTASLKVGTCSISGYVYIDFDNDGRRITPSGHAHQGIEGVVITLSKQTSSGWSAIASTITDANGKYSFNNLAAGTYRVQETQPTCFAEGLATLGTIAGKTGGVPGGRDVFAMELAVNQKAADFNFGELGLKAKYFSSKMLMPSAPRVESLLNTAPVVTLSQSTTSSAVTYKSGGSAVAVASSATIKDSDNTDSSKAMLASLKVTLVDPPNGSSEELTVDTSSTSITASYANNVLTFSGVASVSDYQKVLRIVKYKNNASSPTLGQRTVTATVFDGIAWSEKASTTLSVVASS